MSEVVETRLLVPGDEPRLFELCDRQPDSSLFLMSNAERAGLVDRGEPLQATYVACFDATGIMTAVAAHSWSGYLILQGNEGLEAAASSAVATSGRRVRGLVGSWSLVCRARHALGLEHARATHDGPELLFGLSLDRLVLPSMLERPDVTLRPATEQEAGGPLAAWRVDYDVETLGAQRTPALEASAREQISAGRAGHRLFVLSVAGEVVAMTSFNAEARGIVQVGGVFTPSSLRGRGYARAAVAASLKLKRDHGLRRSVLFTAETNHAARHAYTALGYEVVGDYGLVLF